MTTKTYGQYCGVARALELVGERWALLIVRDLLVGPKRYTDLRSGLPKIPTNVLATGLAQGARERRPGRAPVQPRPSGAIVYELTPYGLDLEPVVLALGRWGAPVTRGAAAGRDRHRGLAGDGAAVDVPPTEARDRQARLRTALRRHRRARALLRPDADSGARPVPRAVPANVVVVEAMAPLTPLLTGAIDGAKARADGIVGKQASAADLDVFATIFQIN